MADPNELQILAADDYRRAVKLGAHLGYGLGEDGDFRILSAALGRYQIVIFEAVSGTDRNPLGRQMRVSLSAEEFDRLVAAVQQFRAEQEARERATEEERDADTFDPFLD